MYTLRALVFFSVFSSVLRAQDTMVVYFEKSSSRISQNDLFRLHGISKQYDLSSVDSIQFIGFADSTGNIKSNMRLSERRAGNILKECKPFIGLDITTSILAKGEESQTDEWKCRRVEIIFFYNQLPEDTTIDLEIIENIDPRCFQVDFEALSFCNIREITKGKRTYVQLEALNVPLFKERKHYYVLYNTKGKVTVQRLNWKLKTTGRLWWKRERWTATIPKNSFEKFQFFTLENAPCTGCSETVLTKDTIIMTQPKYYPDFFLMDNMQTRIQFFGRNKIKIRVPKEYVNLNEDYYLSSHPYSDVAGINYKFEWKEKRGKRKENYYYSTLRFQASGSIYIKKKRYTTVCLNKYEYSFAGSSINCGFVNSGFRSFGFTARLEPGVFYHNDTITSFATAGIMLRGFSLNAGINHRGGFYGSVYFNRTFFSFPLRALSLKNTWQKSNLDYMPGRYGILYAGADVRTSFNDGYQSFLEGNIHLGTNLWNTGRSKFHSVLYLQGGFAYDFLQRINPKPYPYIQLGFRLDGVIRL